VVVREIDVAVSGWETSLEEPAGKRGQPAVRLGLNMLKGMGAETAQRIEQARAQRPFDSVADLARRADLDRHALHVLAGGDALRSLSGHRRQALWQAVGAVPDKDLLRPTAPDEEIPTLDAPSEGEDILGDYRSHGLTLRRHPVALLRDTLRKHRFMPAEILNSYTNNMVARACGMVTVRQRPGTANGVIFMTLEDETGSVNVIIWPSLLEKQRREVLSAPLLGVYGVWQQEGMVRHLVAHQLVDMTHLLGRLPTVSRDFC
jgi:error-prone DNA polymerase